MASSNAVTVEGLTELRKTFKRLEDFEGSKHLRKGLLEAAKIVAVEAKTRVPIGPSLKGRHQPGTARDSIGPGASVDRAYVFGGRKSVKYYGWLDFGSRNPISGRKRSVGPWKKSGRGPNKGRFIYAALEDKRPEVAEAVRQALIQFENEAGVP